MSYVDLTERVPDPDPLGTEAGPGSGPTEGPTSAPKVLTVLEAARAAGISERVMRKRISRGTVASTKVERGGRAVVGVTLDELRKAYPGAIVGLVDPAPGPDPGPDPKEETPKPMGEGSTQPAEVSEIQSPPTPRAALATSVEVELAELHALQAAAGRVPDLMQRAESAEAGLAEERAERRATLQALVISQGEVKALLEGPDAVPVKTDRRTFYALAGVGLLGLSILGWTLHQTHGEVLAAKSEVQAVMGERDAASGQAARLTGELDATRETLRDERERTASLERLSAEAQREAQEAREAVAIALGARLLVRTVGGR